MNLEKVRSNIRRIGVAAGALLLSCIYMPAAQAVGMINTIDILPSTPNASQSITIDVAGEWGNSCADATSSISVNGNNINVSITIPLPPLDVACLTVITPWSVSHTINPLPEGHYYVYATLNYSQSLSTSFDVVAAPGAFRMSLVLNQDLYTAGDVLSAEGHFATGSAPVVADLKAWVRYPNGKTLSVRNLHNYHIGANANVTLPLLDYMLRGVEPLGQYEFGLRLLDPVTGDHIATQIVPFQIVVY